MENKKFDLRSILAVGLGLAVFMGWQAYLAKKYPKPAAPLVQNNEAKTSSTTGSTQQESGPAAGGSASTLNVAAKTVVEPKIFHFETESVKFSLSSVGMGVTNYTLKDFKDREGNPIQMFSNEKSQENLFALKIPNVGAVPFEVQESRPGHFIGKAAIGKMIIERELGYNLETKSFENKLKFTNAEEGLRDGFSVLIPGSLNENTKSSFLMPSYDHQGFVILSADKTETVDLTSRKDNFSEERKTSRLVSFGSQYFAMASLDKSELLPDVHLSADLQSRKALAEISYKPVQIRSDIQFSQVFYVGPKSVDKLKSIDPELPALVDFGWLGFIASPLVAMLKFFHMMVGNWGWAIILLTLVVRLLVLPFNVMSMRSMKAMQKIQPQMQSLREKYKDDPMNLNREMMTLMKESGANPFGGCLPMLLQIPVFFALYRVIGSSVELYQSPFFGWITDLSAHDRFYIFPVLMGIAMFVQQKLTPTTMDPAQAKVFAFMPLIFTVFMLQLPSGLTLYMLVSAIFGIVQQQIMMRDTKAAVK